MTTQPKKGTVILSTTDGGDYLPYLKYTQKAWNMLGWDTLTFYLGKLAPKSDERNKVIEISKRLLAHGYRDATLVQTARLLGGHFCKGLIMTGDVDMVPMSNYWKPQHDKVTVYGEDLTGHKEYPICYIAMDAADWVKVIPESGLISLLDKYPQAKSQDFYTWWGVDQHIITERIKRLVDPQRLVKIDRGFTGGLAKGRVDRADWHGTLNAPGVKIDAHMPRPFNEVEAKRIVGLVQP